MDTLTFRPGSIGDCLMAKYFLENVRAAYPQARATIAIPARAGMVRSLLAGYPWIDVIETRQLPFVRYGLAVTPYTGGTVPWRTKLIARALGRKLVGFSDKSALNAYLYTKVVPLEGRSRAPRLLECDALAAAGIPATVVQPSFAYVPQRELLARLGLVAGAYAVLHLFSGSDARGLSPESKRSLIVALVGALKIPLVLTGTKKETDALGELPQGAVAAETSVQELAHLIDHSRVMVSLDTGAAHIAAHLRKPLVVLSSCVGVQWWSPNMYGEGVPTALMTRLDVCTGGHDYSGYAPCLEAIDVCSVAARAQALI